MQADQTLPVEQRRGYKNVGDALLRMWREEGLVGGVFAGASPTITRALALNVGMLATYDGAKEFFSQYTTSPAISTFGGGLVSGFCASAMSLPFDFVKTRLQKQRKLPDGSLPYKGFVDCAIKVTAKEGPLAFYSGFPTYYIRIAPHIMLTWAGLEFLQSSVFLK